MPTLGPLVALVILIIVFSLLNGNFFSLRNATNVLQQAAVLTVLALGETFVITMGSIDLSIGSTVSMVGMLAALLIRDYGEWAVLAAPLAGAAIGAINGVLAAGPLQITGAAQWIYPPTVYCDPPLCPIFMERMASAAGATNNPAPPLFSALRDAIVTWVPVAFLIAPSDAPTPSSLYKSVPAAL